MNRKAQTIALLQSIETNFYDLFRLENSKIVEHWEVIESITPPEQGKHNNGKF